MANFNQSSDLFGELGFDGINAMGSTSTKKIPGPPPSLNPLSVNSGLYIPPEEINHNQDDVMKWGLSDDQQDSDDDMDGNEFDLDFDDAEFLPPLNYDLDMNTFNSINNTNSTTNSTSNNNFSITNLNLSQNQHTTLPYPAYESYHPANSYHFMKHGAYNNQLPNDAFLTTYNQQPPASAPLEFINPSRLQLPKEDTGYEYMSPENQISTSSNLDMDDLNLDIEFDDLYSPYAPSSSNDHQHSSPSDHDALMPQSPSRVPPANQVQPTTPVLSQQHFTSSPLLSPPQEVKPSPQPRRKPRASSHSDDDDFEPGHSPSSSSSSPTGSRRKGRKSHSNPTTAGAHVCDRLYPDGSQCNRSFTRPYDLVRHVETLHAPVRKTFTCSMCGSKSKTFSRHDALSRHIRLKHAHD